MKAMAIVSIIGIVIILIKYMNIFEYIIKITGNADKVSASVNKLEAGIVNVQKASLKVDQVFGTTINSIDRQIKRVSFTSLIQQVNAVADGLISLNGPGLKLDASLADLQAITGVTNEKLKELEKSARSNAKAFGGSAADSVESYKLILSQLTPEIAKSPEALKSMGESVSILSKTMNNDALSATEVLTTAINQYQVSLDDPIQASKEMARMMNIMAAGAKEGSAELPFIKQALENAGLAAKTANVSFEETNAAIQVLDKAGRKGAEGGVSLRNVLATISQGRFLPKQAAQGLRQAGIDVNVLADKSLTLSQRLSPLKAIMNDTALITELFGKENSNAALAIISGIDEMDRLTQAVSGTNTAIEQANIVMENQAEKNARLKARVDDFKISIFNVTDGLIGYASVLGDVGRDIANLSPLYSSLSKVVSTLTSKQKLLNLWTTITTISINSIRKAKLLWLFVSGLLSSAIATLTSKEKLQALWTGILSALQKGAAFAAGLLTTAQWALNVAMDANPIGAVIALIVILIAVVITIKEKYDEWGAALSLALGPLGQIIRMIQSFADNWDSIIESFKTGGFIEGIKRIAVVLVDTLLKPAQQLAELLDGLFGGDTFFGKFAKQQQDVREKLNLVTEGERKTRQTTEKGISTPEIPGVSTTKAAESLGLTNSGINSDASKSTEAVATGGTKQTTINIQLGKFFETINITGSDFKNNAKQLETQVTDAMLRVLASAQTAAL